MRTVELTLTEGTSMAAAASPDRQSIAIDLIGSVWIVPMHGGDARKITPDLLEARQPTWSPDGRRIAFQGYGDDGVWHIYSIARTGGEVKALTSGIFDDREPAWSPDGEEIAFSSDRIGGLTTIWTLKVATGEVRQVSMRDGWMPSWSPDNRGIYFVSADIADLGLSAGARPRRPRPGVYVIDGARERIVMDAATLGMPSAIAAGPAVRGDGQAGPALATIGGSEFGTFLSVSGRTLATNEDLFPFRPQWLSSTELLYTADGHIKRRTLSDSSPTTIPFSAKVSLRRPTYAISHRTLEPAGPQRAAGIVGPVVSPDGRFVAFAALGDLWLLPVGRGTPVQLTNDPFTDADPTWSPDGQELAFTTDRDGVMNVWVPRSAQQSGPSDHVQPNGQHFGGGLVARRLPDRVPRRSDQRGIRPCPAGRRLGDPAPRPPTQRGELGRPTWSADSRSVAVGALFPFSNRYREGLNQLLIDRVDPAGWFVVVDLPGALGRQPANTGAGVGA